MKKITFTLLIICLAAMGLSGVTLAANYPTRDVEIIVPWGAGGATDLLFRAVASVFPKYANGKQLLVKNVAGGAAVPGTIEFVESRADGHTLLGMATPIVTVTHMSTVPFTLDQLKPVIMLVDNPCYILVPASSPYQNLENFVAAAKANPGGISIGNGGAGGGTHLTALAFEHFAGVEYLHVPFQGGGPSITAVVGEHIDSIMASAPEGLANLDAGQLRMLGVFGDERLDKYPDVLTAAEQGFDFTVSMWRGVCVPEGTPDDVVAAIHEIMLNILNDPEFIARAEDLGVKLVHLNSEDFGEFIKADDKLYETLVKETGIGTRY